MNFKWGKRSIERMDKVNEDLVECATRSLSKCSYDMTIPWMGGVRTSGQQKSIYTDGNSKCDGITKKSYHQSGNALDIIPVNGGYSNDLGFRNFAKFMFETWQEMKDERCVEGYLYWGGNWSSFVDKPHWEIRL